MRTNRYSAKIVFALVAFLLAGSLAGLNAAVKAFEIVEVEPGAAARTPDSVASTAAKAIVQLGEIPVRGRASETGFSRNEFGQTWADIDRNGCDTRNDILARDLFDETFKPGTNNCVVATGTRRQVHRDDYRLRPRSGH
jgi:hypothetical protein